MRRALVFIAAVAGALVLAASAQASSLVFIKDGNVWLAHPDGSGQYQVTLDGTSAGPYYAPSQADDGTIVAARGHNLYRMSQNGTLLNAQFEPYTPGGNIFDPRVSPDGRVIAYGYSTIDGSSGHINVLNYVGFTDPDRPQTPSGFTTLTRSVDPSWAGNSRVLVSTPSDVEQFYNSGDSGQSDWWSNCDVFDCSSGDRYPHHMQMSRAGDRLAMIRNVGDGADANTVLDILTANGGPPTLPTPKCELSAPSSGSLPQTFATPSWAPDGQSLAWQEGDGVHVGTNLDDCNAITGLASAVIPDGSEPFWGPADVNPAPRPVPGSGATTNPGSGGGGSSSSGGGGASSSSTRCVVPKLKAKTLAQAKKALVKAHCKLGKVSKPRHVRHGAKLLVASQSRPARHRYTVGTKVAVKLAVHRAKH